ncbi:2TM domain-containing protein [Winogradskyella undariae]|uniref:2TM domain-containing protein n=1 Tax=Winogradskyella TaxID=286104 RepID=UPI00156B3C07|nr:MULTISPECIES: 2TM domain-containing protein [Winogradskyella]NRR90507.1 2TM domain-containing protein [Winogradskyella undariae]QXP79650.1 2TM domain-containing protein [Winogradskyella sp. HaHa_3_26]
MKIDNSDLKYLKAKKKVEKLKAFYTHLSVYFIVNTSISGIKIISYMNNGKSFMEAFFELSTSMSWLIWGVAIVLHGLSAFDILVFFGEEWRERKIKKLMDDELSNN